MTLGPMQAGEAYHLINDGRSSLPADSSQEFLPAGRQLAAKLEYWPLALSLARAALQEELALAGNEAKALEELEDRVDRHGIVAFDLPGGTRETSIARALEGTLTRG